MPDGGSTTALDFWSRNQVYQKALEVMKRDSFPALTKNTMYGDSPIVCKGTRCPYADTCGLIKDPSYSIKELEGSRCPIEAVRAAELTEGYCLHFLDETNDMDPILIGLIKELVDYDLQVFRADRMMQSRGDFLQDVVIGVTPKGQEIVTQDVAKWVTYKSQVLEKKHRTMVLLNSTPKDKAASSAPNELDAAKYMKDLLERANELDVISPKE